jgi:hypothetical protein
MKTLGIIFTFIGLSVALFAQQPNIEELKKKGAFLRFEPSEVNLGTVATTKVTNELGEISITVHNEGVQPLILNQVTACCGTRVVEWPKEPIAPGQKGTIKVSFRVSPHPHRISRTVTVVSNAVNGNTQRVAILGEIVNPSLPHEIKL